MGAGFGGCTIDLVREAELERFDAGMTDMLPAQPPDRPAVFHVCRLTDGTAVAA